MGWSMDWVHGPGPWGGPWTRSIGWSMDPGPCFVYVRAGHGLPHVLSTPDWKYFNYFRTWKSGEDPGDEATSKKGGYQGMT